MILLLDRIIRNMKVNNLSECTTIRDLSQQSKGALFLLHNHEQLYDNAYYGIRLL